MGLEIKSTENRWSWVVVCSSFFAHFFAFGIAWTTGPIASLMISRFGCRVTMMLGGVTSSLGLVSSYFATNMTALYFTFGIITGLSLGAVHLAAITSVTIYFDKFRNIATGIAVTGVGVGTLIFPPFIRWLVSYYSWRGSLLLLGGMCLNTCVCGALIRPTNNLQHRQNANAFIDPTIYKKINFWMMCLNNFFVCFGLSVAYIHLTAYAKLIGVDFERSALLVSGIGVANLIGRLGMGVISQHKRVNAILLYLLSFIVSGVAVGLMVVFTSFAGLLCMALVFGVFTAGIGALSAPILADIVGVYRFAGGYGFMSVVSGAGQMLGGPIAGLMFDKSGTYGSSFIMGAVSLCVSSLFMLVPLRRGVRGARPRLDTTEVFSFDMGQGVPMVAEEASNSDRVKNNSSSA